MFLFVKRGSFLTFSDTMNIKGKKYIHIYIKPANLVSTTYKIIRGLLLTIANIMLFKDQSVVFQTVLFSFSGRLNYSDNPMTATHIQLVSVTLM